MLWVCDKNFRWKWSGNYETYKANNEIDKYLRAISYKIKLYKESDPREEEEKNELEEDEEQYIGGDENDLWKRPDPSRW